MPRKSYLREALTARTGRSDLGGYLRELYVDRRFTDKEIATHLNVSREAVRDLRRHFGIARSERTAALL